MTPAQPTPSSTSDLHAAWKIRRTSLNIGVVFGAVLLFLTIIGMLTAFRDKYLITGVLTLTHTLLIAMVGGAGYTAGKRLSHHHAQSLAANGAVAGGVVGAMLALFRLLAGAIDLRGVFPNVSPGLLELLNFGQEGVVSLLVMVVGGVVLGVLGALLTLVPRRAQAVAAFSVLITLLVGLMQEQVRNLINLTDGLLVAGWVGVGYALAGPLGSRIAARVSVPLAGDNGAGQLQRAIARSLAGGVIAGIVVVVPLLLFVPAESTSASTLVRGLWLDQPSALAGVVVVMVAALLLALVGALTSAMPAAAHNLGLSVLALLLILGVVQAAGGVTLVPAALIAGIVVAFQLLARATSTQAQGRYSSLPPARQRVVRVLTGALGLLLLLLVPQVSNLYITSVLDQVGLYILMGLGLNIVVGYAGLLDLGYVAFFAIGAYAAGIMTTPNMITCPPPRDNVVVVRQALADEGAFNRDFQGLTRETVGVVEGSQSVYAANMIRRAHVVVFGSAAAAVDALMAGEVTAVLDREPVLAPLAASNGLAMSHTFAPNRAAWSASTFNAAQRDAWCNIPSFWVAWPLAGLVAAFAGTLLGIPVLRMRGDYLAIVTLGFGEIIRLVALSDTFADYLGGAQGVTEIPSPIIDLSAVGGRVTTISSASDVYYLILFSVLAVAFVAYRLSHSRLGRSWMAMREDEDVAEATGISLVNTKLLAFTIGATFAGIGGAIFSSWLHSIFPNSFTLLVSINVLSLVIIGGIGSIPGVVVGAFALIGLPEVLREFSDYRLLMFGALLVVMMLLRPEGLVPASSRRLELHAEEGIDGEDRDETPAHAPRAVAPEAGG